MLSCGVTILASEAEVQEFYSLARALGMDKGSGESAGDGPEQQPPLPRDEGEDESGSPDLDPPEEDDVDEDEGSEGVSNETERDRLLGDNDNNLNKQKNNEEKDKKFQQLKSLINKGQIGEDGKFPCPLFGCKVDSKHMSSILNHLCGAHFRHELKEKRRKEFVAGRMGMKIDCVECKQKNVTFMYHYGVVHKDLAEVALEKVALEVQKKEEQAQQQESQQKEQEQQKEQQQNQQQPDQKGQEQQEEHGNEQQLQQQQQEQQQHVQLQSNQPQKGVEDKEKTKKLNQGHKVSQGQSVSGYHCHLDQQPGQEGVVTQHQGNGQQHKNREDKEEFDVAGRDSNGMIDSDKSKQKVPCNKQTKYEISKLRWICKSSAGYDCFLCKRNVSDFANLKQHFCSKHFKRHLLKKNQLGERHRWYEPEDGAGVRCTKCQVTLKSTRNLIMHHGIVHNQVVDMALKAYTEQKNAEPTRVKGPDIQSGHSRPVHNAGVDKAKLAKLRSLCPGLGCPFCSFTDSDRGRTRLLKHMSYHHFRRELERRRPETRAGHRHPEEGQDWRCRQCAASFPYRGKLMSHYGVVHGDVLDLALEALERKEGRQ